LAQCGWQVLAAVICHNSAGMLLGYWGARLLRCDKQTAITIAIETGMQNSGLAVALTKQFFTIGAALPGALFSVWHNISGAFFAILSRRLLKK
jgi:BASS family bile acid:Na+ symporter